MDSNINSVNQKEQNNNKTINIKRTKKEKTNTKLHHNKTVDSLSIRIHIGIIGPPKCGKSSLLKAFIFKTFNPSLKEDTYLNIHKLYLH